MTASQSLEPVTRRLSPVRLHYRAHRWRLPVLIEGPSAWTRAMGLAATAIAPPPVYWIGPDPPAGLRGLAPAQARELLGQETGGVVIDGRHELDADAIGAVAGTLTAGGLLILLLNGPTSRLARRLARGFRADPWVAVITPSGYRPPRLPAPPQPPAESAAGAARTPDQARAVARIRAAVEASRPTPMVLTAPRGRGKSTALGLAAAELLTAGSVAHILVTAPQAGAVDALFHPLQRIGTRERRGGRAWRVGDGKIRFLPPDALRFGGFTADVLLVDEAAGLPAELLGYFLQRFPRIVFATTTEGYEGHGQGFAIGFRDTLERQAPAVQEQTLGTPIRWAAEDPLEPLIHRLLVLAAQPVTPTRLGEAEAGAVAIERIPPEHWDEPHNETDLQDLVGLLTLAHYQTRPRDVQRLLDDPKVSLWCARVAGRIVGALVALHEGALDPALAQAIYAGRRRPPGHLLPQSLAFHLGYPEAATLPAWRVHRIAVHPALQGRGIGSALVAALARAAASEGVAYWGASFGLTPELLRFWFRAGLSCLRIGVTRQRATARYPGLLVAPASEAGRTLVAQARARFRRELPLTLADPLREVEPELVIPVLDQLAQPSPRPATGETAIDPWGELPGFARGERTYETAYGALWRFAVWALGQNLGAQALADPEKTALVMKVLQHHSWETVAGRLGAPGRRGVIGHLRQAVQRCPTPDGAGDAL